VAEQNTIIVIGALLYQGTYIQLLEKFKTEETIRTLVEIPLQNTQPNSSLTCMFCVV